MNTKTIHICYFASLREQRKLSKETLVTDSETPAALYDQLQKSHHFTFSPEDLRVAINDTFVDFKNTLNDGDIITFIPPVAGG